MHHKIKKFLIALYNMISKFFLILVLITSICSCFFLITLLSRTGVGAGGANSLSTITCTQHFVSSSVGFLLLRVCCNEDDMFVATNLEMVSFVWVFWRPFMPCFRENRRTAFAFAVDFPFSFALPRFFDCRLARCSSSSSSGSTYLRLQLRRDTASVSSSSDSSLLFSLASTSILFSASSSSYSRQLLLLLHRQTYPATCLSKSPMR